MKRFLITLSAVSGLLFIYALGFYVFFTTHMITGCSYFGTERRLLIKDDGIDRPLYCLFSPILYPLRVIWHQQVMFVPHRD